MKIIKVPDIQTSKILYDPRFHLATTDKRPLIVDTLSGHKFEFKNEEFNNKKIDIKEALLLGENRAIIVCINYHTFSNKNCAIVLIELNVKKRNFKELSSFKGPRVEEHFKHTRLVADQNDSNKFICYNPHYHKFFCYDYSPSKGQLTHLKNIIVHIHRPLTCLRVCSETLCGFFYENVMSTRRFQILDYNDHVPYTFKTNISPELLKTIPHSMSTTKFTRIGSRAKQRELDPIPYTELYSWSGDRLFVVANSNSTIILSFDSITMTWLGPIIKLQRPANFLHCLSMENLLLNDGKSYMSTERSNGFNIVALRKPSTLFSLTVRSVINFNQVKNSEFPPHLQIKYLF